MDILTVKQHMLETINATVSHEMRNPINAIHCQNLKIEDLIEQLDQIISYDDNRTLGSFKNELKRIRNDMKLSLEIQLASTKLLIYLVNDLLSFA